MLSIAAPSKFILTLQSVPPFLFESVLAFCLVLLLCVPLIARVSTFLQEKGINDGSMIVHPRQFRKFGNHEREIIGHQTFMPVGSRISANQINTILPIARSTINPNFDNSECTKDLIDSGILVSNYDYDYYRNTLIEENLKRQYGNRQAPGNVVLNSLHLNTIDSKTGLKLDEKYSHGIFDFIEEFHGVKRKSQIKFEYYDPLNHFLRKNNEKPLTSDSATETNDSFTEIDQVPELVNFVGTPRVATKALERRKLLTDGGFKERPDNFRHVKSPRTPNRSELLENPSRPSSTANDVEIVPNIPKTPKKIRKNKEQLRVEVSTKRPSTPIPAISRDKIIKKSEKEPDALYHPKLTLTNEKLSTTCPSEASSEAFSSYSNSSRQSEKRLNSRPNSSSGPPSKTMKTLKSKVNSKPKTGDNFDWDVPDVTGKNYFEEAKPSLKAKLGQPSVEKTKIIEKIKLPDSKPVLESFDDLRVDIPLQINCPLLVTTAQNTEGKIEKILPGKRDDRISKKKTSRPSTPRNTKKLQNDKIKTSSLQQNENIESQMSTNTFDINEDSSDFPLLLNNKEEAFEIETNDVDGRESICTVIEKFKNSEEPISLTPDRLSFSKEPVEAINDETMEKSSATLQSSSETTKITTTQFVSKLPILSSTTSSK